MTTTPDKGAGVSRYLRLYSVLSQALAEGRIVTGQPLPSEPQLMKDYAVSRSTVRRALARLEAEGRIVRKRGSGTYARGDSGSSAAPGNASPVLVGTAGLPSGTTSRTIAFEQVATPGFLLGERPAFGDTSLLIRQIRYLQREPIVLASAYLPREMGARLTRRQLDAGSGAILPLLATLGYRSASLEREFSALPADPLTANSLGLAIGAPVLNVRAVARDLQHRILAYINFFYRPDRYEAHTSVELGDSSRDRTGKRS
jgi:GntR family transcriptional regulator